LLMDWFSTGRQYSLHSISTDTWAWVVFTFKLCWTSF
jgi:hypothetical protein